MVRIVNERLCYKFTTESQGGRIWKISRAVCKILLSLEGVSYFVMLTLFIVKLVILFYYFPLVLLRGCTHSGEIKIFKITGKNTVARLRLKVTVLRHHPLY